MPAPPWTDGNRSDPGVTLVQLLAFVVCALLFGWIALRLRTRLDARD